MEVYTIIQLQGKLLQHVRSYFCVALFRMAKAIVSSEIRHVVDMINNLHVVEDAYNLNGHVMSITDAEII